MSAISEISTSEQQLLEEIGFLHNLYDESERNFNQARFDSFILSEAFEK